MVGPTFSANMTCAAAPAALSLHARAASRPWPAHLGSVVALLHLALRIEVLHKAAPQHAAAGGRGGRRGRAAGRRGFAASGYVARPCLSPRCVRVERTLAARRRESGDGEAAAAADRDDAIGEVELENPVLCLAAPVGLHHPEGRLAVGRRHRLPLWRIGLYDGVMPLPDQPLQWRLACGVLGLASTAGAAVPVRTMRIVYALAPFRARLRDMNRTIRIWNH